MSIETVRKKVTEGVRFLDKTKPGWQNRINLETLNMEDCEECILGQLYGTFSHGRELLNYRYVLKEGWVSRMGFDADIDDCDAVSYSELTEAWLEVLKHQL